MTWAIDFYPGVEDAILDMPPKLQARMLRLLELVETHGANLGPPHTQPMGKGLFEIRAKAQEGIARTLFCYMKGKHVYVLHAYIKKTQKTPSKELNIALQRMKQVQSHE